MKRKSKYIFSIVLLAVFTGCDLTVVDKTAVVPTQVYTTLSGAASSVNSLYRHVYDFDYYGQEANIAPEILADNMQIVNRTGRYEQEYINAVGTFMQRWIGRYNLINEANFAIAGIKPIPLVASTITDQLKGEAYFHRALAYFELLRVYAYEPGKEVNSYTTGVIMRTTPTTVLSEADKRTRGTNIEGYQQVEADLLQALALVPEPSATIDPLGTANVYPYRVSKQAVYAFLSKVYLYWGRYADAATNADKALAYPNAPLVTAANYVASFAASPHPESIFEAEIRSSDWSSVDGANNSMCSLTTIGIYGGSQYVVAASPELINAHETGDIRKTLYVTSATTLNKPMSKKWPGEKTSFLENIPIIRRSEVVLISAEAKARGGDDPGAQTAVNSLRANRGLTATTATGTALINLILNERRVELAFEGHRWFDLKRNGLDITKPAVSNAATLPYTNFRILQQIPNTELSLNPNLKQNPGY